MAIKSHNLVLLTLILAVIAIASHAHADSSSTREYQIKAAFVYNFIKFVDWPDEEKAADANQPIIIGIIGKDQFRGAFESLKDRQLKGRKVLVSRFKGVEELEIADRKDKDGPHPRIDAIRKCYVLFICASEQKNLQAIINSVRNYSVLTVGDMEGFIETGGIINLLKEEKKVRFEINLAAAKLAKLNIRSRLLRLAKRVLK